MTVRPALDNFYNSLTDEQKAAFDAIGPERNGATNALAADRDKSQVLITAAVMATVSAA